MGNKRKTRGSEPFVPVRIDGLSGYRHPAFDFEKYWPQILRAKEEATPFYALKTWRTVFRLPLGGGRVVYFKDIDETRHENRSPLPFWASNEAQRYLKHYDVVRRLDVHTARLLFVLGQRDIWGWRRSVICTEELGGFSPFPEFFTGRDSALKHEVLERLCTLTRRMHDNGYYFSLDGHNLMVRDAFAGRAHDIALIDLDHLKRSWGGQLPTRRRKRSLRRFARTISGTPGLNEDDFAFFAGRYHEADHKWR